MSEFANRLKTNVSFIVRNSSSNRTIKIFCNKIEPGRELDLLSIPGVSIEDIKTSMHKGDLGFKLRNNLISITFSDIDSNPQYETFLETANAIAPKHYFSTKTDDSAINLFSGPADVYSNFETFHDFTIPNMPAGQYIIRQDASITLAGDSGDLNPTVNIALFVDNVLTNEGTILSLFFGTAVGGAYAGVSSSVITQHLAVLEAGTHSFTMKWRALGSIPAVSAFCSAASVPLENNCAISVTRI